MAEYSGTTGIDRVKVLERLRDAFRANQRTQILNQPSTLTGVGVAGLGKPDAPSHRKSQAYGMHKLGRASNTPERGMARLLHRVWRRPRSLSGALCRWAMALRLTVPCRLRVLLVEPAELFQQKLFLCR